MKVGQLYKAFQTNYRTINQPMLQTEEPKQLTILNNILARQTGLNPDKMIARFPNGEYNKYRYEPKNSAHVKSELIRRNLLSRKDLMQLYRPPLKKSQMAENNPF